MKKLISLFTLLCTVTFLTAQVTVTDATFPAIGDTLKTRTHIMPAGIEVGQAGGDLTWDFTSLNGQISSETVFLDASGGTVIDEVPNATHLTIDPNVGGESYFQVTDEEVRFLAAFGDDPTGFGLQAIFRFTPPIVQRRAPMTFPSLNSSSSNLLIGFAWSDLPAILTDSLSLPIAPDSIRVRIAQERDDFVDAWGTVSIPGGTYDVLREKRTEYTETGIDAKVPFLGWTDVTDILLMGGGFDGLGKDTTISYNYFSESEKEVIAVITMDNEEQSVTQAVYKDNGIVSTTIEAELLPVTISPNPASSVVRLELGDFPQGEFELKIFALTGSLLLEKTLQITNCHVESLDISDLPSGNHVFQIADLKGKTLASGKIVKQ